MSMSKLVSPTLVVGIFHESANFVHACRRTLDSLPVRVVPLGRADVARRISAEAPSPDLVLVDLDAPGAAGGGLLADLRKAAPRRGVILLSSHGLPARDLLPGWRVLRRPFEAADLRDAVRAALGDGAPGLPLQWGPCPSDPSTDS